MEITQARIRYWESMRGKSHGHKTSNGHHWNHTEDTKEKMRQVALLDGRKPDFTGRHHSEETKKVISEKIKENPTRYWLGKDRSAIFTEEYRRNMSDIAKMKLANGTHPAWKGGRTKESQIIRTGLEYRLCREFVFKRDDYRCFDCGERGGELNMHHIYPFSLYPRLRFMTENCITLCKDCHKNTSTYGRKVLKAPALALGGGGGL